ncbi:MAG TPA: 1,2-phenylacetyl-CoA epoxidase subunit PaaC [Actinomycetota bacterium]|nr:1,2-phenylacetyl-CoA epoxidase subunit PaaC [Actinomycetota bacterium]
MSRAIEAVLLAVADDELVMGHRHSEWTGWAPHIEEDIAFSSIAQDEIGHANLFYGLLWDLTDMSPDEIAMGRGKGEYRNSIFVERQNGDWAKTLARHLLYEAAEKLRLEEFGRSSYQPLADVSEKLLREERYHQMHAEAWLHRLATGPLEGRHLFAEAISAVVPEASGFFETLEFEDEALAEGVLITPSSDLLPVWLDTVMAQIESSGLDIKERDSWIATPLTEGGRHGIHTADFDQLWDDLTRTYREEPTATW